MTRNTLISPAGSFYRNAAGHLETPICMTALIIRDATTDDMQTIAAIYAYYVLNSCCTFEEIPPDIAEMRARLQDVRRGGLPYFVAEIGGRGVVGYSYASPFHRRAGYRWTLEDSVYVEHTLTGQGIGTALLERLIAAGAELGYRQMMAVIGDSANQASILLHARAGFRHAGLLSGVGFKHGRWVDVVQMQLPLGDGSQTAPPELSLHRGAGQ